MIIATKTSNTSIGWTIPSSFYAKIPNSTTGTVTLTCTTYSGNTNIGSKTTTFTVSVPTSGTNSCKPVIESASVVDDSGIMFYLTNDNKRLVRYKSWIQATIVGKCVKYASFSSLKEGGTYDLSSLVTTSTSGGTTTVNLADYYIYSDIWRTTI